MCIFKNMYNICCYVLHSLKYTKSDTFELLPRGTSCCLTWICSFFSWIVWNVKEERSTWICKKRVRSMLWELINDSGWLVSVSPPSFHKAKSDQYFSFKVTTAAWSLSFSQPLTNHRSVLEDLITGLIEVVINNS